MAKILVVDDEQMVLNLVGAVLRQQGHHILAARNGADAERLAASGIDLLITDVRLGPENGLDVARAVTALHTGVPVLFITGFAEQEFAEIDPNVRVLLKPFTPADLRAAVDDVLAGSRS